MAPLQSTRPVKRSRKIVPTGITREDSDDELGSEDHPWQWVYADNQIDPPSRQDGSARKRKRTTEGEPEIVGARMGSFACKLGDPVLLKAEGSGEAWVGIICQFLDDEDGEKSANFMWFSSEREIRNKQKKRTDHLWVCHPASPGPQLGSLSI